MLDVFTLPADLFGEETFPTPFPPPEETRVRPPHLPPRFRLGPRVRRSRTTAGLPSSPALFPWLARRFAPGQLTLWTGARVALDPVLELLYAGNALGHGRISLLEGSNRFNPYRLGEVGRGLGVDAAEVLRRIRLARSFTAYQMVALVDAWSAEARRHPPTLLIGHDLPAAFSIDDVPEDERAALLRHVAGTLRTLAESLRVPLLLTLDPAGPVSFPGLGDAGPPWCDLVTFTRGPGALRLRALRDDARLALVARPPGQRGIEEFGGGAAGEVIAWGAPSRRTARPSRSG
jgi:Rad51